jgi:hypothetical protein
MYSMLRGDVFVATEWPIVFQITEGLLILSPKMHTKFELLSADRTR